MPAKRLRPQSFSPPPPPNKGLQPRATQDADSIAEGYSQIQNDLPWIETALASTTGVDAKAIMMGKAKADDVRALEGISYIEISDEEEDTVNADDGCPVDGLLGLHADLTVRSRQINSLLAAPVGDSFVKLTEIPEDAGWNQEDQLGDLEGRALVIVAYGSLHFVNLMFGQEMAPSFSVTIELFRDADRMVLQQLYDWAGSDQPEATRMIRAFRAGHDEHARFLNMYSCIGGTNPADEGISCGINEFAAGDVVRVVMRCMKVVDEYNGRVMVDFKLRKLDLVVPIPRRADIRN